MKSEFKILIAEDDEIARDVYARTLSEEGYPVVAAHDGLDAIKIISFRDVKLVLTDFNMPGADGMHVLEAALEVNPKIAVIILTAYDNLDPALKVMDAGAYNYLIKPFSMQQLLLAVRNAHKRALLLHENEELSKHLRETYHNLEIIETLSNSDNSQIVLDSIERIKRMRELNILNEEEAEILNKRFVKE